MKANSVAKNTSCGVFIPADTVRDKRLPPAARIVFGLIQQLAKSKGYCHASNKFLAEHCGLDRDTVSSAIKKLLQHELVAVRSNGKERRISVPAAPVAAVQTPGAGVEPHAESFRTACGILPHTTDAENVGACAESIGACAESIGGCAENDLGHLKKKKEKEDNYNEKSSSLSLVFPPEGKKPAAATAPVVQEGATQENVGVPGYDLQQAKAVVATWGQQVVSRMSTRVISPKPADSTDQPVRLGIPSVGIPSRSELDQLFTLALNLWPNSDPNMAFRQLLRASGWTPDRRDTLQYYACQFASGTLAVRALLRIGKPDPLTFIRDAAGAVPPPPLPVAPGTAAMASTLQILGYDDYGTWTDEIWALSWLEAAGRARAFRISPQIFMAVAHHAYEQANRTVPLPWFADSFCAEMLNDFAEQYGADRRNAWSGGPCRRDPDPNLVSGEYRDRCIGQQIAKAVALGRTTIRSRQCLLCAATELRLIPELVKNVSWPGTAEELADRLEALARQTDLDEAPIRGAGCGQSECTRPSFIRCLHGKDTGIYLVDHDDNRRDDLEKNKE